MRIKNQQQLDENPSEMSRDQNTGPKYTINIKIILEDYEGKIVQEMIENFSINKYLQDQTAGYDSSIILKKLLLELKNTMNFPFENKQIYFYLQKAQIYLNCGIDPINEDIKIRSQDFKNKKFITVKAKDLGISMVYRLMTFQNTFGSNEDKEKGGVDEMAQRSKCRRTKQRRIGHIIDKVIEWRKFYSGSSDKNQSKLSLQEAAKKVQISKKSLDDYLFQVRFGHKYKFNFNQHYNDKVGVLRDFVRQKKKNDKIQNKRHAEKTKVKIQE